MKSGIKLLMLTNYLTLNSTIDSLNYPSQRRSLSYPPFTFDTETKSPKIDNEHRILMKHIYTNIEQELNNLLVHQEHRLALEERINALIVEYGFVYKKVPFQKYTDEGLSSINKEKKECVERQKYEEAARCRVLEKEHENLIAMKKIIVAAYGEEKSRFSIVDAEKRYLVYFDFGEY